MKPSEFVMKELKGKTTWLMKDCKIDNRGIITIIPKDRETISLQELNQALSKLNNTYISVEEQNKKLEGYRRVVAKVLVEHEKEIRKLSKFETPRVKKLKEQHKKIVDELIKNKQVWINNCNILQKEIKELKEEPEEEEDEHTKKITKIFKKDFPLRKLNWDYIHELEHLVWWHSDFGSMMKKKLEECKQQLSKTIEIEEVEKIRKEAKKEVFADIDEWKQPNGEFKEGDIFIFKERYEEIKQKLTKKRK